MIVVKNNLLHKAFEAAELDYEPLYGALREIQQYYSHI